MLELPRATAASGLLFRLGPSAPTYFAAVNNNSYTSNFLSWSAPLSSDHTGFKLERAPYQSTTWTTIYEGANKNYTDTGLSPNTIYQYRVSAKNINNVYGQLSNIIERQTLCVFNSSGTWIRPAGCTSVELLVVGGGGSGGGATFEQSDPADWGYTDTGVSAYGGGGGGAVRYYATHSLSVLNDTYSVVVGLGGTLGGSAAGSSSFNGIISPGGFNFSWSPPTPANGGASGAGAGGFYEFSGAGLWQDKIARSSYNSTYGHLGADTNGSGWDAYYDKYATGGGGGGAGGAGSGLTAGNGISNSISGASVVYGKGGAGCSMYNNSLTGGSGAPSLNTGGGGSTKGSFAYYSSTYSYALGTDGAAGIVIVKAL